MHACYNEKKEGFYVKKLLCILIALLFLTGCGGQVQETNPPETILAPTEPPVPWVEEQGQPWDREGALVELPLEIPNGISYASYTVYDGDLLFWSLDHHLEDQPRIDICILDLDTGKVLAQADIPFAGTMSPQVLGEAVYLTDNGTCVILKLDKQLNVVQRWETGICDASMYLDANNTVYVYKWDEESYALNLETGEKQPILAENPEIAYLDALDGYLRVEYFHPDSGESCTVFLDLYTGQRQDAPIQGQSECEFRNGIWLFHEYEDSFVYTLFTSGGEPVMVDFGYNSLRLMDHLLLKISDGNRQISLHDLSGRALGQCTITDQDYGYDYYEVIPNEELDGYFILIGNYDGALRLLFWDTDKGEQGEDIPFAPIPTPSELEAMIQQRVSDLEAEYGLNILVGEEAGIHFFDFNAERVTNLDDISDALDTLERALEAYPDGFFRQLRYGEVQRNEIHLAGTLTATNSEYTDTYEAFVQDSYDCHVMVVDIYLTDESTYFHEFSHIIDSYLEWDAMQRTDALFSDEAWCSLNPGWFPGYTYDYSWEQYVEDYSSFVDSYSTINPTEDRARVLEYAMVDYGYYTFEDSEVLLEKLDYYCRCIRDAFDTSDWPESLPWEQYLP
jgi:hypothetical protein